MRILAVRISSVKSCLSVCSSRQKLIKQCFAPEDLGAILSSMSGSGISPCGRGAQEYVFTSTLMASYAVATSG